MSEKIPNVAALLEETKTIFRNHFNEEPLQFVYAPGRVNLIGEHTDYNGGFVMPMALPLITIIVGKKNNGSKSYVYTSASTVDTSQEAILDMEHITDKSTGPKWSLYVRGVIANYIGTAPAFKAVIHSTVPIGGGLASSAALEVAVYYFLDEIGEPSKATVVNRALACQQAEHEYAGVPCGIMDQFVSFMGKTRQALLIDCQKMTVDYIPLTDPRIVVLITNSNVKHELTGGEYSTRRKQCEEAAQLLKRVSLREATTHDLDYLKSINANEEVIKRAKHVISENRRTKEGAEMLKQGNYMGFGRLMAESHNSLRDDYNVSCSELDDLVELAMEVEGVLGSRMTGAGFGGCTVTLLFSNAVEKVMDNIRRKYKGVPTFYICEPSEGAAKLCDCRI
ncbi:galactokinase [Leptinotarsa decemlineata]|uniref:galactokinase n=1 Tax=Leptinotarsa decemlineata TaxID=7539 RepID=UPI000C2526BE|nr:galactokinase-like [Leptinotarsa decemlineata]